MLDQVFLDMLRQTILTGERHRQRLSYAMDMLKPVFPLDRSTYENLTPEQVSITDQLVYRFSKLQDLMGNKLFRILLQGLGEPVENIPFLDIIIRLEKLELIEDHSVWLELREARNLVAHEYPFQQEEFVESLNGLYAKCSVLSGIWTGLMTFASDRFKLDINEH